ncbi:MAG: glycosyltransferase family 39 protein [Planctomycetia bacterium]|nr:glycosyltransferase family 39 protein [Planctomycetia bacterium]
MDVTSSTPGSTKHSDQTNALLLIVLAATVAIRTAAIAFSPDAFVRDVDGYRALAESLAAGGGYAIDGVATAYRPPLYPLLLAALAKLGILNAPALAAVHVALGTATVWLVAQWGRSWGLGRWRFLAALLVACDPILLRQSALVMTETLAVFVVTIGLVTLTALAERATVPRAAAAGASLGLAALCRPALLLWLLTVALSMLWLVPRGRDRVRAIAWLTVGALAALLPWAVRNQAHFGRPVLTTTHGGFTLLLANNPRFYEHLRTAPDVPWDAAELTREAMQARVRAMPADELANDRREYAAAWRNIRAQPRAFLRAAMFRLSRLWGVMPLALPGEGSAARALRYGAAAWYALEFVLALAGAWSLRRRLLASPVVFGLLLAATLSAAHALYWTDMRMRAPATPVVALAAAAGAARSWRGIPRRKANPG